jgi:Glycosyltransferase family 87
LNHSIGDETTSGVQRSGDRPFDGRWLLLGSLVVYFGVVAVGAARGAYDGYWARLGVPPMSDSGHAVPFGDTVFLLGILECDRAGYDVYRKNPCDPWGRRMNYSRLWLLLSGLPLEKRHSLWMGTTVGMAFLACMFIYVGPLKPWQAVVYGIVICSPSVMLGIERGNSDLIMFVLVAVAVMLLARRRAAGWSYLLIFLGGLLKFFPIAALAAVLRESRSRAALILFGLGTAWVGYIVWTWSDLTMISRTTDRSVYRSYGGLVLLDIVVAQLRKRGVDPSTMSVRVAYVVSVGIVILAAVAVAWATTRRLVSNRLDGFRAGAAMYIATYLPATNYDYKQVFLVLAIPQMLEWSARRGAIGRLSAVALASMALTLWMSSWHRVFLAGEVMNLLLFAYCLYMLVYTRPSWLGGRDQIRALDTC